MWNISSIFSSFHKEMGNMEKDFKQMEKDFNEMEKDFEKAVQNGGVIYKRETRPDGTQIITRTVTVPPPVKAPSPAPKAPPSSDKTLEDTLWERVYFRVRKFWATRATVLLFDDKNYSIGFIDPRGMFVSKGIGTSLDDAVKEVERKFTPIR